MCENGLGFDLKSMQFRKSIRLKDILWTQYLRRCVQLLFQLLARVVLHWENNAFVISKKSAQKWVGIQKRIHVNNKLFVLLSFHQVAKCASVHILTALESTPNCARNNLVGSKKEIRAPLKSFVPLLSQAIVKVAKDLVQIALARTRKLA